VGEFKVNQSYLSQQGAVVTPNVESVSCESVVVLNGGQGAGDARLYMEFVLGQTPLTKASNFVVTYGHSQSWPATFTLTVDQGSDLGALMQLATYDPQLVKESPGLVYQRGTILADNTVNVQSNVVNGCYYAGIPQTLQFPLLSYVQSTTEVPDEMIVSSARLPVEYVIDFDASLPRTMRCINLLDFVGTNPLPLFVYSEFYANKIQTQYTSAYGSLTSVGIPIEACPPITSIPSCLLDQAGVSAVHYCLRIGAAGPEIVCVPNRFNSVSTSVYERTLVWIGSLIYPFAVGVSAAANNAQGSNQTYVSILPFEWTVPLNARVVSLVNLNGNNIYHSATGYYIVPEGQRSSAYVAKPMQVSNPEEIVSEANTTTKGSRARMWLKQ